MYFILTNCLKRWETTIKTDSSLSPVFEFIQNCTSIGWDYHFLLFSCVYSVVLHRGEEDDLSKGNHLAENEPDVDHLDVGGGGGRLSILLMKIVVITSIVVRFTLRAASKKNGLKKVVAKVIAVSIIVGK